MMESELYLWSKESNKGRESVKWQQEGSRIHGLLVQVEVSVVGILGEGIVWLQGCCKEIIMKGCRYGQQRVYGTSSCSRVEDRIIVGEGVKEMKDQSFERGITYVDIEISRN